MGPILENTILLPWLYTAIIRSIKMSTKYIFTFIIKEYTIRQYDITN
jgi:hypothetical protein